MKDKALRLALEALDYLVAVYDKGTCGTTVEIGFNNARSAITAIEQALKQPEPEPVAWMYKWNGTTHFTTTDQWFVEKAHPHFNKSTPLYASPPKREPLSSEEIEQLCYDTDNQVVDHPQTWKWTEAFARAIEAAHGIGEKK